MATVELTKDNFEQTIADNDIVLVDFWAPWCAPCKQFAPIYEQLSDKHTDVVFARINTDEQQELAQTFQIRSIPTLMLFREQVILFSEAGAFPAGTLEEVIGKARELDMDEVRRQVEADQRAGEQGAGPGEDGATG
ncbi:MAG: thioredoxin [Gammaproteobacteria bacterium]|nr:thioredoxin [Gammaproteobacteria bacterium]